MSATNSALHNVDILNHIFGEFDVVDHTLDSLTLNAEDRWFVPDRDVQKSLARAALTCHAFKTPALDTLWEKMQGILPLLKLLPALTAVENIYVSVSPSHIGRVFL